MKERIFMDDILRMTKCPVISMDLLLFSRSIVTILKNLKSEGNFAKQASQLSRGNIFTKDFNVTYLI